MWYLSAQMLQAAQIPGQVTHIYPIKRRRLGREDEWSNGSSCTWVVEYMSPWESKPLIGFFRDSQMELPIRQDCGAIVLIILCADRYSAEACCLGPDVPLHEVMFHQTC